MSFSIIVSDLRRDSKEYYLFGKSPGSYCLIYSEQIR